MSSTLAPGEIDTHALRGNLRIANANHRPAGRAAQNVQACQQTGNRYEQAKVVERAPGPRALRSPYPQDLLGWLVACSRTSLATWRHLVR